MEHIGESDDVDTMIGQFRKLCDVVAVEDDIEILEIQDIGRDHVG